MARFQGSVLLDNNAIGDAVDLRVWNGLLGAYDGQLETVAEVEGEAGSYFRRKPNGTELMESIARLTIHQVTPLERASLYTQLDGMALDAGEQDLWAHAHMRQDGWILCGPDKASLRAAVKLGLKDRLVSLEQLLKDAGLATKGLREHQTKAWLDKTVGQIVVEEFKP
ncbi:MAG: hypothetical protein C0510_13025 [Erythrobacter sp.]|nr:hypothetical protein [Erythrobacter sp.]